MSAADGSLQAVIRRSSERVVHKSPILGFRAAADGAVIQMPLGHRVLHVDTQHDGFALWYETTPAKAADQYNVRDYLVRIYGTGHPIGEPDLMYQGTVFWEPGLVFHVYTRWVEGGDAS